MKSALYDICARKHPPLAVEGKDLLPPERTFLESIDISPKEWTYLLKGRGKPLTLWQGVALAEKLDVEPKELISDE